MYTKPLDFCALILCLMILAYSFISLDSFFVVFLGFSVCKILPPARGSFHFFLSYSVSCPLALVMIPILSWTQGARQGTLVLLQMSGGGGSILHHWCNVSDGLLIHTLCCVGAHSFSI